MIIKEQDVFVSQSLGARIMGHHLAWLHEHPNMTLFSLVCPLFWPYWMVMFCIAGLFNTINVWKGGHSQMGNTLIDYDSAREYGEYMVKDVGPKNHSY